MSEKILNRPTPAGREMGEQLARLCDEAEAKQRKQFPNMKERCNSCAFRRGTIPNGCEETVMDALKATIQMDTFMCHMHFDASGKPDEPCVGWLISVSGLLGRKTKAPWPYSHECDIDAEPDYADADYAEGRS